MYLYYFKESGYFTLNTYYFEKIADMRTSNKYIDFIYNQDYLVTIKNVERIKQELTSFKVKPEDNWYITIHFDDLALSRKYVMEHSTDYNSKYRSFKRVVDRAMKKFNVNLNELINKRFYMSIASIYRLDKSIDKYTLSYRIIDMKEVEECIN